MTKFRLLTAFIAAVLIVPVLAGSRVSAEGSVNVTLYAESNTVKAGDTIALSVSVDTFPNLLRFGPIEVQFDPDYVTYTGMDKGQTMPSTFSVSNTASTGVIAIIGVDQTAEGIASVNQTAPVTDAAGNPVAPPADPTMYSESLVTLCVLYFKVIDEAPTGDANFWLGGIGGFKDSSLAQVGASAGNTAIVPVQSLLSSEASLSSLSVEGSTLSPAFSPSVFEYETHVSRSVTIADITAAALDPTAEVMISGNDNLVIGDNPAKVRVAAQDGRTAMEYKINIIRDSNYVPDGASITGTDGTVYDFVELPQTLSLPLGFSQQMEMLGSQSVPVFTGNGYRSMLLYLQDGENEPAYYIYNPDNGSIRLYQADLIVAMPARLLTITQVSSDTVVPKGFFEADVAIGETVVKGYISQSSDVSLVYLTDEAGVSRFYEIDAGAGDVYPYEEVQTQGSGFLIPFVIAAVLATAEFGMIFYIIYQVRSRNRPKEVKRV